MKATESSPSAAAMRQIPCVRRRENARAKGCNANENTKHTAEYIPKHNPPHWTPSVYDGDSGPLAPNTWCATATGKYSHMQNSPNHVQSCTGANCLIVRGISRIA